MQVFALLDDCAATDAMPTSRLYTGFMHEYRCEDPPRLDEVWRQVEGEMRAGHHAVVLADFEWGVRLQRGDDAGLAPGERGALRFLIFSALRRLSSQAVAAWLAARERETLGGEEDQGAPVAEGLPAPAPAGVFDTRPSLGRAAFGEAMACIQEAILAGETYQVNFTCRLDGYVMGSPMSLYRRLRARQPVAFGAFLSLPPGAHADEPTQVLSCSPELFLRNQGGRLQARPMKGTAARAGAGEDEAAIARELSRNPKTRAENLMIVDLLRNDLGRVASTGSVRVPDLFAVETHPTLLQMTSTIEAELPPTVSFPEILRATFPCGSITGAPKHRTLHWIRALETSPRGLYTGAIGWIEPPTGERAAAACGDFCLSVAIRTLTLGAAAPDPSPRAPRSGRLGIGAGIVSDSRADEEYDECQLKARFLTELDPGFSLFETLYARRAEGIRHLERHLARLGRSAAGLGFRLPLTDIRQALAARVATLAAGIPFRIKLILHKDGSCELDAAPLDALPPGPLGLLIAATPVDEADPLLGHKTTWRARYDRAIAAAIRQGAFDMLFHNRAGRITEGARSNLFLKLDGAWVTPPLSAGVLPGVMRGVLLDDPTWGAREAPITLADLDRAEAIRVCNALRGVREARLIRGPGPWVAASL